MNDRIQNKKTVSYFWTIWFPMILVLVLVVALVIIVIVGTSENIQVPVLWAQISTIFLIIPALILGIILFLVLLVSIKGMNNLKPKITPLFSKTLSYSSKINHYSKILSRVLIKPILWVHQGNSIIKSLLNRFKASVCSRQSGSNKPKE